MYKILIILDKSDFLFRLSGSFIFIIDSVLRVVYVTYDDTDHAATNVP